MKQKLKQNQTVGFKIRRMKIKPKNCIYLWSHGNDGIVSSKLEKMFNKCTYIATQYSTSDGNGANDDIFSCSEEC